MLVGEWDELLGTHMICRAPDLDNPLGTIKYEGKTTRVIKFEIAQVRPRLPERVGK
jgi:hypothetical protein